MSAISLILLCAATTATALGGAALHTARGLRGQLTALRAQLETAPAAAPDAALPRARDAAHGEGGEAASDTLSARTDAFSQEIRTAVAAALADERERELAEARAFWAAQEARGAGSGAGSLLAGHGTEYAYEVEADGLAEELDALLEGDTGGLCIPRQPGPEDADDADGTDFADYADDADLALELDVAPYTRADDERGVEEYRGTAEGLCFRDGDTAAEAESPGLAAARRRHPSQPDYTLDGEPVVPGPAPAPATPTVTYHERTVERLTELADARTPLADVRPGPLGTLDVYVFEDGTTVCLAPGHRATSEALADGVRRGQAPVLMGGSGIAGSYALTFAFPDGSTAYLLADRVITPL
ncbi:hypothetical protein [Streptomyces qinglanensis]|uniref:Secreted protein n=1 Tax=Streptomyces qinglanensis TaxID=943816 RepID=A0A1H9VKN3_9ACTN|nr:hypothetical protein [Streptomyces qinglanensis]SES21907.1 hypothetical protein SAMN05421870_11272 [Streptomyces qinglanensis]